MFEQPGDVSGFLQNKTMVPILSFFDTRPSEFANVPTHKEVGANFEALLRFRGFFVKKGVPQERIDFLSAACKAGFNTKSFQEFNKKKFMHLIDSFRDTKGSIKLVNQAVKTYQDVYKKLGITK